MTSPPSKLSQQQRKLWHCAYYQQAIKNRWADIESIHVKSCEASNKAIVARSWVQDRGKAQRTGGQIQFHLPDQYVPYLVGCDGTQLGWNEYELIN